MKLGMYSAEIKRPDLEELFAAIRGYGFEEVQFDFMSAGREEMPERIESALLQRIKKAADDNGIRIIAVNGTFNMIHPDPLVRQEGIRRFELIADACKELGANLVSICTGSRSRKGMWEWHAGNATESAFQDLLRTTESLIKIADAYDIYLGLETEEGTCTNDAARSKRLLDEVQSPRLKVIMDCANLFQKGQAYRRNVRNVIQEAFELLGDSIILAHGKDIEEGAGVKCTAPGFGIVDYEFFLELLKEREYQGCMLLHGVEDEKDFPESVKRIREIMLKAGC